VDVFERSPGPAFPSGNLEKPAVPFPLKEGEYGGYLAVIEDITLDDDVRMHIAGRRMDQYTKVDPVYIPLPYHHSSSRMWRWDARIRTRRCRYIGEPDWQTKVLSRCDKARRGSPGGIANALAIAIGLLVGYAAGSKW